MPTRNKILNIGFVYVALIFLGTFAFIALSKGWTWGPYDEVWWSRMFFDGWDVRHFLKWDFSYGRFRPVIPAINFLKFSIFNFDPHLIRVERFAVFGGLFISLYAWLRSEKLSQVSILLTLVFLLKAPPLLELFHIFTLSELPCLLFFTFALISRKKLPILSHIFLITATLTKEPFAFLLPIPAILERKWKEASAYFAITSAYLGTLFFMSLGKYYRVGFHSSVAAEIARQIPRDFGLFLPVFVLLIYNFVKREHRGNFYEIINDKLYKPLILVGAALVYAASVFSMSAGWTFHFAPPVFLFAVALGLLINDYIVVEKLSQGTFACLCIVIAILPARLVWNVRRLHEKHVYRTTFMDAIRNSKIAGTLGTNCPFDGDGYGFATDRRPDDVDCYASSEPVARCCERAKIIALISTCDAYANKLDQARSLGLPLLAHADDPLGNWYLFDCSRDRNIK